MGSAENGGGQHLAPEWRQIGTPPPWDVYDTFPKMPEQRTKRFNGDRIQLGGGYLGTDL